MGVHPMLRPFPGSPPGSIPDKPADRIPRKNACHGTYAPDNAGTSESFHRLRTRFARTFATHAHKIEAAAKCTGLQMSAAARFEGQTGAP